MELIQLRHFLAAVQYGNLVKAATESHISQSGLSRSIQNLEARLGVPLLIRRSNGVAPTSFGESLVRRAQLILNEVGRAVHELRTIETGESGSVTIGITPNYSFHIVPDVVIQFLALHQNVTVEIVVRSFPDLVDLLKAGSIDFAFALLGAIGKQEGIEIEEVCDSYAHVISRADHPLAGRACVTLEDLSDAKWAMLDSKSLQAKFASFFVSTSHIIPVQVLKTNSIEMLTAAITRLDLLTVLPSQMVQADLAAARLVILKCATPAAQSKAGLLRRKDMPQSPHAENLCHSIRLSAQALASPGRAAEVIPWPSVSQNPRRPETRSGRRTP